MYLKRKYQVGGIAYTPYLPAQAGSPQESTSSSGTSSGKTEKITGTVKKEIIDLLKENGIPSDVSVFLDVADKFLTKSKALSNYSLFGGTDDDYDMSDLIKVQKLVNDVKYNKSLSDEAIKQVSKEAAGSEVAITDTGRMYVQDKDGTLKQISVSEYAKNRDAYVPLTNNELLYYRQQDPNLAFKTNILNDLQNTIGMSTIMKNVRDTINQFGSDKVGGYTTKDQSVNRGMQLLMAGGPDGYYKFEKEEELRDVNRALKYLYNSMSDNAKNLLRAKAAVEGGDPSDPNDISNLLYQALLEHTDYKLNVSFDKSASDYDPNQTGKKGGSTEQKVQDTYLYRVASLNGPRKEVRLAPKGSKIADTGLMITQGITNGAVVDDKMQRIGDMSLSQMLQQAEAVKAADASTIVLGNKVLSTGDYGAIMFDSSQECNTVLLPYTYDDRGQIVPDFDVFEKFNQLQRAIAGKFAIPKTEVDRLASSFGLDSSDYNYDSSTNSLSLTKTSYFLTFGAIVGDDTVDLSKEEKRFLTKIDRDEGAKYVTAYNNMLKYGKVDRKKSDMKVGDYGKATKGDFYRGILYMAMPDAYRGTHLSMNEYINKDDVNNFGRRTELRQQQIAVRDAYAQEYGNDIGSFR